jgi:hypothetical protein
MRYLSFNIQEGPYVDLFFLNVVLQRDRVLGQNFAWYEKYHIQREKGVSIDFSIPPAFGSQARCLSCGPYKNKCDTVEGDIVERYNRDWRREVYHQVDDCYGSSRPDFHYRKEELDAFLEHQRLFRSGRVLFRTGNSLGLGPLRLRERDSVWLLDSSKVAIILRKIDSHYLVIGESHLHGALRQHHPCPRCRKGIQLADTITTETIEIW